MHSAIFRKKRTTSTTNNRELPDVNVAHMLMFDVCLVMSNLDYLISFEYFKRFESKDNFAL